MAQTTSVCWSLVCVIFILGTTNGSQDLYLVGGDTICFSTKSSQDDQRAVIDSMLFSELAADAHYGPGSGQTYTPSGWLQYYTDDVMSQIGWIITSTSSFNPPTVPYVINSTQSYLHEIGQIAIGEIAKHIQSDNFTAELTALFNGLIKAGAGSKDLAVFSKRHTQPRKDLLLVGVADSDRDDPIVVLLGLNVDIDLSNTQKLLSKASKFNYKVAFFKAQLNWDVFKQAQSVIETRLGDRLKTDVFPIATSGRMNP